MKRIVFFILTLLLPFLTSSTLAQDKEVLLHSKRDSTVQINVGFKDINVRREYQPYTKALNNNTEAIKSLSTSTEHMSQAMIENSKTNARTVDVLDHLTQNRLDRFLKSYNLDKALWDDWIHRDVNIYITTGILFCIAIIILLTNIARRRFQINEYFPVMVKYGTVIVLLVMLYYFSHPVLSRIFNSDFLYYKTLLETF